MNPLPALARPRSMPSSGAAPDPLLDPPPDPLSERPPEPPLERPAAEAGFRSAQDTAALDWPRLAAYLASCGHQLASAPAPRQFAGGFGNLNFLLNIDGRPCVLRRPPFGEIPAGANDMAREDQVLSRLWRLYPLAPRGLLYCPDASVIGAHFLLMEYRPGLVIGPQLPVGLRAAGAGRHLSALLVETLARLHAVDAAAAGLSALGRPEGFLRRTAEGWIRRARAVTSAGAPVLISEISRWLVAQVPPQAGVTLLHSDFKLDNLVLDPVTLAPRAVLDWDMCTRGDPLFDLATLLSYWVEPGDPEVLHRLRQMPTAQGGFDSRAEVMRAYASITGRDLSNFLFYRVLALFKLGVVFLQLHARFRAGATSDPRYAGFGGLGHGILELSHAALRGRHS